MLLLLTCTDARRKALSFSLLYSRIGTVDLEGMKPESRRLYSQSNYGSRVVTSRSGDQRDTREETSGMLLKFPGVRAATSVKLLSRLDLHSSPLDYTARSLPSWSRDAPSLRVGLHALIVLAVATGMRQGELFALQ